MRRRKPSRSKRSVTRIRNRQRKTRALRGLPIGLTLYYYPRTQRLTPTLYDPELERLMRRGLAKARELLARRGSAATIQCVLVALPHGAAFWLGENDLGPGRHPLPGREKIKNRDEPR